MASEPKVLIGIPSTEIWFAQWGCSFLNLMMAASAARLYCNPRGPYVTGNREACLNYAENVGATHLFYLDADTCVPPSALDVLLAHEKPIVAATYARRIPPFEALGELLNPADHRRTGLVEMKRLPFGCFLIDLEALKGIERPVIRLSYAGGKEIGEDWTFCDQIVARVPLYCDCDLSRQITHTAIVQIPTPEGLWPLAE